MTSAGSTPDIVFRGTDGTEAEEFIAAIEELAFAEGWSKDRERMLLYARSRLRHKALRWFATLDPSNKNDWDLFVEALFNQYPLADAPTEPEISTPVWSTTTFSPGASTAILPSDLGLDLQPNVQDGRQATGRQIRPAAFPESKVYDPSVPGRRLGVLRIVVENETTCPQYVWRGRSPTYVYPTEYIRQRTIYHDQLGTTIERQEALVVCFIPSAEPHPIGCLNARSKLGDLSLHYPPHITDTCELRLGEGVVANNKNIISPKTISKVWNVLSDGSLEASLFASDTNSQGHYVWKEDFKTSEVHVDTSGASIRFVKPGTPLWQDDPKRNTQPGRYDFRARVVFEPLSN